MGEEPTWNGDEFSKQVTDSNYKIMLGRGLNWYNYVCDVEDHRKFFEEWIQTHRPNTEKKDLARLDKLSEKEICPEFSVLARIARMHLMGFPLDEGDIHLLTTFFNDLKRMDKVEKAKGEESTGPSVQDRMKIQVQGVLSEIDQAIDDFLVNDVAVDFDSLREKIFNPNFKAPHLAIIEKYIKRQIDEWQEAMDAMDGKVKDETSIQLTEGYAYAGKKILKNIIDKFSTLTGTLVTEGNKVRMVRIRKKKPTDKRKMVAKLKLLKECKELGLTSINPVDIIGASVLWVYDCKKRKLGYYEGEFAGSLHVKGTTILGVKPSFQKTLRKPDEQMTAFSKLRKNQTANFFGAIKAKPQALTGRTNADLILLRAD
jgi:hypothetical protein